MLTPEDRLLVAVARIVRTTALTPEQRTSLDQALRAVWRKHGGGPKRPTPDAAALYVIDEDSSIDPDITAPAPRGHIYRPPQ